MIRDDIQPDGLDKPHSDSPAPAAPVSAANHTPAPPHPASAVALSLDPLPAAPTESMLGSVSVRALLALIVIVSLCAAKLAIVAASLYYGDKPDIAELKELAFTALGYVFARQTTPPKQ